MDAKGIWVQALGLKIGERIVIECASVGEANSMRTLCYRERTKYAEHDMKLAAQIYISRIWEDGIYKVQLRRGNENNVIKYKKDGTIEVIKDEDVDSPSLENGSR